MSRPLSRLLRAAFVGTALVAGLTACTSTTTLVNGVPVAPTASAEADPAKRAQIRTELAGSYFQTRQFSVALEELQRALQIDPNYAPAHSLRGLVYMELGDAGEAENSLKRAISLDPDNGALLNNYGWFLCQNSRERESIAMFERAAANRLYATPGMALRNAGICLARVKDLEGAERMLRRSFERDAGDPVTRIELGRIYLTMQKPDRARFYYGLLEKGPPAPAVLWLGVRIANATGDVRTERELSADLQKLFPDSAEAASMRRGAFNE
jgi:type IV pilus assembly protein PilF